MRWLNRAAVRFSNFNEKFDVDLRFEYRDRGKLRCKLLQKNRFLNHINIVFCFSLRFQAIYELIGDDVDQEQRQIDADERAMNIFRMMDKNNDNVLSREEFVDGCMNDEQLYQLLTQSSRFVDTAAESQSSGED